MWQREKERGRKEAFIQEEEQEDRGNGGGLMLSKPARHTAES